MRLLRHFLNVLPKLVGVTHELSSSNSLVCAQFTKSNMPQRRRYKSTLDDYTITDDDDDDDEYEGYLNREAHQKLVAPPDFEGPIADGRRGCTDAGCLGVLLLSWVFLSIIGYFAIRNGDYRVIVYPMDYDGNICGLQFRDSSADMTEYPYLYYVNSYTGGVCVKECPSLDGLVEDDLTDMRTLITYNGVWQTEDGLAELENVTNFLQVADYSESEDSLSCSTDLCFPKNDIADSWNSNGIKRGLGYAYYVGDTYPLFRRCYLTSDAEVRIAELTNSTTDKPVGFINPIETHAFWTNLYGDLWTARYFILAFGFGVSLLISLTYVILLRIPFLLTILIWTSILGVIAVFAAAGYYAQILANRWAEEDPLSIREEQVKYTEYASYGLYGLATLFLLLACCLRGSVQTAVGCVREAGKAINRMSLLFGLPFLQGIALLGFWAVWGYYAVHLASMGEIGTRSFQLDFQGTEVTIRVFEFDDFIETCGWYMLFSFLWTGAFVLAVGNMSVSLAVARWYFTREKRRVNSYYVLGALATVVRYHLGTCAFGSLVLSIVRILRAILIRLQKVVARLTNPKIANMLLCCCQCCICCLERILKFINKNAYIQCAIFGSPFGESGRKSFFLILRNVGRIGSIAYVGGSVLFIGKIFISALTTAASYYVLVEQGELLELDLYSYGGPVLLIFCISYFVASMFMGVFDMGILTVLHCLVADEEMFGSPIYAEGSLSSWVDRQEARIQQEQEAAKDAERRREELRNRHYY